MCWSNASCVSGVCSCPQQLFLAEGTVFGPHHHALMMLVSALRNHQENLAGTLPIKQKKKLNVLTEHKISSSRREAAFSKHLILMSVMLLSPTFILVAFLFSAD